MPAFIYVDGAGGGAGILDGLNPTGAWSFSRNLLTAFGASARYSVTGSPARVTTLFDQSGNSRNLTDSTSSGRRPLEATAGPNSRLCGRFDGSQNGLTGVALSNFVANNAKFMIFSAVINGGVTLNAANVYQNHHLFGDGGSQFCGFFAKNVGGTTPTFLAYNWDGNADSPAGSALSTGTVYVVTLRHEGGNLFMSVNGAAEVSVASGNTTTMTSNLLIGAGGANNGCDMSWLEGATWSSVPSSGDRTTIINAFKSWVGAV